MEGNHITEIRVKGLRTLADVTLKLDGLTVLIGHNGSGKSSLIEACEILRRAAGENFAEELQQIHGGSSALARFGCDAIEFTVEMSLNGHSAEYSFAVGTDGRIHTEELNYERPIPGNPTAAVHLLERYDKRFRYAQDDGSEMIGNEDKVDSRRLVLSSFGSFPPHWMMREAIKVLRGIDVHLPFDTAARWAQRARGAPTPIRGTSVIEPADSLTRFGNNLANAFHELKNNFSEAHWKETMDFVRLGLGFDIESINTRADAGGGSISLRLKYAGLDEQIPAFSLSDGTLSYLCFVALARLNSQKSLIAFDEPETHLHPELLMRVLGFFETMAEKQPVLLATHSDRLLDGLTDPARSVIVCELDERRATQLRRLDKAALTDWLADYRGVGDIRTAGHMASLLAQRETP